MRPFGWLRLTRSDTDHPRLDSPEMTVDDVQEDLPNASKIIEAMTALLPHLALWQ